MRIRLTRLEFTPNGIFGRIDAEDGSPLVGATLEHSYEGKPKMPAGIYPIRRYRSPHFGYDLFRIYDVPGHEAIELHIGNLEKDSEGCVLLGLRHEGIAVLGSKLAFDAFMKAMVGVDAAEIEVIDCAASTT